MLEWDPPVQADAEVGGEAVVSSPPSFHVQHKHSSAVWSGEWRSEAVPDNRREELPFLGDPVDLYATAKSCWASGRVPFK